MLRDLRWPPQCHPQESSLNSQITLMLTGVLLAHAGLSQFFCFLGPLFLLKCFFFFAVSCSGRLSCVKVGAQRAGRGSQARARHGCSPRKGPGCCFEPCWIFRNT